MGLASNPLTRGWDGTGPDAGRRDFRVWHQSTLASALLDNTTPTFLLFSLTSRPAISSVPNMPGVTKNPAKRVLGDASSTRQNIQASPRSAKKLKLDDGVSTNGKVPVRMANGSFNASQQQKSRFEEEVLEQMSQDIESLKQTNAERDQHWQRPPLPDNFNEMTHGITMQQIDAEEGVLNGGKGTVKLFGVTEVRRPRDPPMSAKLTIGVVGRPLGIVPRHKLSPLLLYCCPAQLPKERLRRLRNLPGIRMPESFQPAFGRDKLGPDDHEGEHSALPGQSEKPIPEDHSE